MSVERAEIEYRRAADDFWAFYRGEPEKSRTRPGKLDSIVSLLMVAAWLGSLVWGITYLATRNWA